jgi:hypothetical protein
MGQLILSMGPELVEVHFLVQKAIIPSKIAFLILH